MDHRLPGILARGDASFMPQTFDEERTESIAEKVEADLKVALKGNGDGSSAIVGNAWYGSISRGLGLSCKP